MVFIHSDAGAARDVEYGSVFRDTGKHRIDCAFRVFKIRGIKQAIPDPMQDAGGDGRRAGDFRIAGVIIQYGVP